MTAPKPREELPAAELKYLEDNIATVAWHLGRPGASIAVSYDNGVRLIVDAGAVLNEISRRLDPDPAQGPCATPQEVQEACAQVADRHKGSYARRSDYKRLLRDASPDQRASSRDEERGEDIAAEMIAKAIRALIPAPPSNQGASK